MTSFRTSHRLPHPPAEVWAAAHDPAVLRQAIPGCEELRTLPEHSHPGQRVYAAVVVAQVAKLRGTYRGTGEVTDLPAHGDELRLTLRLRGKARCGSVDATATCLLLPDGSGSRLEISVHADVGGLVARVGDTLLTLTGKLITGEAVTGLQRAIGVDRPVAV